MRKKFDKNVVVALDIGTTKVVVLIGLPNAEGKLEIIGMGTHPSTGLKKGVVVNIEATMLSIKAALEDAQRMAGCKVSSAFTGIAGAHIRSLNSHGIVAIRNQEVTQADIDRVIEAAKAVAIPADQKILHILPQEFVVDAQEGVRDPIGMSGVRLESKVHIVTGAVSAAQNIIKCVQGCGLAVSDIILEQIASSHSVLTEDEKELGVCLIDIGGGTTDIAIFINGAVRHTAVIPIAGDQVTNDIAIALRTPTQYAESIKVEHASALLASVELDAIIEVPSVAHRDFKQLTKRALAEVVSARYEELFALVLAELRRSGFESLIASGIVLTGGASKTTGVIELAESIFGMPVRLGLPHNVCGLSDVVANPAYATGVGLLLCGKQNSTGQDPRSPIGVGAQGLWQQMKVWFQKNF